MDRFLICICFLSLFSCKEPMQKEVIVIFDKPIHATHYVSASKFFRRFNPDAGVISYLKKDTVMFYSPKKDFDTLKLSAKGDGIEVVFKKSLEPFRYYLMTGDTVLFHLDSLEKPFLDSKVSKTNTKFYNLPYQIKTGVKYLKMHPSIGLVNLGHEMERIEAAKNEFPEFYEKVKADFVPRDSLVKSIEIYNANFVDKIAELKENAIFSKEQIKHLYYLQKLSKHYLCLGKAFAEMEKPIKGAFDNFYNDDYIQYVSYKNFLEHSFGNYYEQAEVIPRLYGGTTGKMDSRETFNKIMEATNIPPMTKNFALKFVLQKVVKQFTEEEAAPYAKKYVELTKDSSIFEKKKQNNYAVDDLLLKDLSGNEVTFEKLQQKHKGKVLYVDFWASWCGPCKYQIPASKKLHKKLEKEEVVFLYFAFRDSEIAWKKACKELGLEENSYFIVNPKTAKIIADCQIRGIPHYLLFDKNGKLVDKNAPRPKQEASEKAILKYLNE